jgi:hypothetical protein
MVRLAWALCALVFPGAALAADPPKHWTVAGHDITLHPRTPDTGNHSDRLVVAKDGRTILEIVDNRISLDDWRADLGGLPLPVLGSNVTGGDTPQMVIETYSGGAHCCFALRIVDLSDPVRVRDLPFHGDYSAYFRRTADGEAWELVGAENVFAYWHASFAGSPAPRVVYRLEGDRLILQESEMRRPAPSRAELLRDRANWDWSMAGRDGGVLPYPLLQRTYDLIYSGHLDAAQAFFDAAWDPAIPGRAEIKYALFSCQLHKSEHWPAIAALNGVPADPPAIDCPR